MISLGRSGALLALATVFSAGTLFAADPGLPDLVVMDSAAAKAGQSLTIGVGIQTDDTTSFNARTWLGVGSFCIPLKYDPGALRIDSVKFVDILAQWDQKFTNVRIDTGFISLAGIYSITGKEKPSLYSPSRPLEVIRIFLTVSKNAKPGIYSFERTSDPIQKEMYFGSPDGMHSWKPQLIAGKIVVQ